MNFNKFKLLMLFLLSIPILTKAQFIEQEQQAPPPIPDAEQIEKMIAELSEILDLNLEQTEKITELFVTHFDEMKANQELESFDRNMRHQEMDKKRQEFENQIKEFLTIEQLKQFDDFLKKHDHRKNEDKIRI